jgi:hypothetical protein
MLDNKENMKKMDFLENDDDDDLSSIQFNNSDNDNDEEYAVKREAIVPISLDEPDCEPYSKRQRAFSSASFDICGEMDYEKLWEAFDPKNEVESKNKTSMMSCPPNISPAGRIFSGSSFQQKRKSHQQQLSLSPQNRKQHAQPAAMRKTSQRRKETTSASSPSVVSLSGEKYSLEQRKVKIHRYLEKRSRRIWRKEIKYSCRKQFAEARPRVAGRFIPKAKLAAAATDADQAVKKTEKSST